MMRLTKIALFFVWIVLVIPFVARADVSSETAVPSLHAAVRISAPLTLCGEPVPTDDQQVKERYEKEMLLALGDRPQVILWLKRSRRYLAPIEKMLKEHGLPDDLKYVAIAESALRAHVRSRKGAVGFWQFMTGTGKEYGLVINRRIDERRNLHRSTRAAMTYLKELYATFNSWALAIAAYNLGEKRLAAEIEQQGIDNYYDLYLPPETQRFIFRIISIKQIFFNSKQYGFNLSEDDYYPPRATRQVQIKSRKEVPIRLIARAGKTHFKVIKDLNPEIRGRYLAKGTHQIRIPQGGEVGFKERYQQALKNWGTNRSGQTYMVKKGDSLSLIAQRFKVSLLSLVIWNRLDPSRPIHPGDRLVIHPPKRN
jgi:membrane-bound lytic murein transglycosylase D